MKMKLMLLSVLVLAWSLAAQTAGNAADPAAVAAKEAEDIEKQATQMIEQIKRIQGIVPGQEDEKPAPVNLQQPPRVHAPAPGNPVGEAQPAPSAGAAPGMPHGLPPGLAALAAAHDGTMGKFQQKIFQLVSDEKFLRAATEVWDGPNRPTVVIYQVAFFLLMIVVRAWQQSKTEHWLMKTLIGFACTVITWAGVVYFVPRLILGEPFRYLLRSIMDVFFS
jgi:hypothetical protein